MIEEIMADLPSVFNGLLAQSFLTGGSPRGFSGERLFPGKHGLTRDLRLAAGVRWWKGDVAYAFSLGTALALVDASAELACHPDFMPEFGSVNAVEKNPRPVSPQVRFHDYSGHPMGRYTKSWPFTQKPLDGARRRLFFDLFDLSTKFIALHEQGHFVNGHLHFVEASGTAPVWSEIGPRDLGPLEPKVLEIQADTFAARILSNTAMHRSPDGRPLTSASSHYVVHCLGAALAIVFALLEINDRIVVGKQGPRTHPSAGARLLSALRPVVKALGRPLGHDEEMVYRAELEPEDIPFDEVALVLEVLGAEALSPADIDSFFLKAGEHVAGAARAQEAVHLLLRVADTRQRLRDGALHALEVASRFWGPQDDRRPMGGGSDSQFDRAFGHMTVPEFTLYLMEAVIRSGNEIPWERMGRQDFLRLCIELGAPNLRKQHPGVFFA